MRHRGDGLERGEWNCAQDINKLHGRGGVSVGDDQCDGGEAIAITRRGMMVIVSRATYRHGDLVRFKASQRVTVGEKVGRGERQGRNPYSRRALASWSPEGKEATTEPRESIFLM
jgi:hypothetical protein